MTEHLVSLFVEGEPVQQGSKSAALPKGGGKPVLFDQNAKTLRPWRKAVKQAAERVWRDEGRVPIGDPVQVEISFVFTPTMSDPDRHWRSVTPDLDKLERALYDGLVDGRLLRDDSLVVQHLTRKRFAEPGEVAGAHVKISSLADHEALASTRRRNERMRR